MNQPSLLSYWFIALEICLAAIAAYLVFKLLRTSTKTQEEPKPRKFYFIILAIAQLIVVFATIIWPLLSSKGPSPERIRDRSEVRVRKDSPATIGDLKITLIETRFDSQSGKYKVDAKISSPSYPELPIVGEDEGYQVSYSGKDKYEIRVLAVDNFTAKFRISVME